MNENFPDNPQIQVLKSGKTGLFTNYIYKAIPLAFDESMSYYETLCGLLDYLKNVVIPTVNNNADAVAELQTLYEQLRTFVDDYFTNLDVQDEINNKLDEMVRDGTIYNIINNDIFNNLNSQILENAENISEINNNIPDFVKQNDTNVITMPMLNSDVRNALTGGSTPIVAKNSITNEDIQNKSISIYKLDDFLNDNYNIELENIDFSYTNTGFIKINDNDEIEIDTDNQYKYAILNLTKDKEYVFKGFNFYSVFGIIITDNENNIITSTKDELTTSGLRSCSLYFRPLSNNLKAYINIGDSIGSYSNWIKNNQNLFEISNIGLNYREQNIDSIKTIENFFGSRKSVINSIIKGTSATEYNCNIYKMNKGTKYIINTFNHFDVAGVIITDENMKVIYSSSNSSVSPKTLINYEFIASTNGYIYLTSDSTTTSTIQIENIIKDNKYSNKKWAIIGDSLSDPITLGANKMYADYIHDDIDIIVQNLAKSGSGYWKRNIYNEAFYQRALNIDIDTDVITLFGSWNDLGTQKETTGTQIIGTPTDTGTDTICGCINTTFDNIFATCPNAVVGVILPTPWYNHHGYTNHWDDKYLTPLKTICINRSIPYLDLYEGSNLMPWNDTFNGMFYKNADGTHPNTKGQKRIAGLIEEFIKSLLI